MFKAFAALLVAAIILPLCAVIAALETLLGDIG